MWMVPLPVSAEDRVESNKKSNLAQGLLTTFYNTDNVKEQAVTFLSVTKRGAA